MSRYDRNYSGYIRLINNKDEEAISIQFEIQTTYREGSIKIWTEDNITDMYSYSFFLGIEENVNIEIQGYLEADLYSATYDISTHLANHWDALGDWHIIFSAHNDDENGNPIYFGSMDKILASPQDTIAYLSNVVPNYGDILTVTWDTPKSTDNVNFPIAGMYATAMENHINDGSLHTNSSFGERKVYLSDVDYVTYAIPLDVNTNTYNIQIAPKIFKERYNAIEICSYLYWQSTDLNTNDYKVTPILSRRATIKFEIINHSTLVLYIKDSEGNFLLGETMFVKDSNGNWRQAESIQQNN